MASYEIETMLEEILPLAVHVPALYRPRLGVACTRLAELLQPSHSSTGRSGFGKLPTSMTPLPTLDDLPEAALSIIFQVVSVFRFFVDYLSNIAELGQVELGPSAQRNQQQNTLRSEEGSELGDFVSESEQSISFRGGRPGEPGSTGREKLHSGKTNAAVHRTPQYGRRRRLGSDADPTSFLNPDEVSSSTASGLKALSILEGAADIAHRILSALAPSPPRSRNLHTGFVTTSSGLSHSAKVTGASSGSATKTSYDITPSKVAWTGKNVAPRLVEGESSLDVLAILRIVFNSDANARFWVRWFGTEDFSVERWRFVESLEKELNHVTSTIRKDICDDFTAVELDFNGDGLIDVVELALGCASQDLVKYVEAKCKKAMAENVGPGVGVQTCINCLKLESELTLQRRTIHSLQEQLTRLNDREELLQEIEWQRKRITDLQERVHFYESKFSEEGPGQSKIDLGPESRQLEARTESGRLQQALLMFTKQRNRDWSAEGKGLQL